MRIGPYTIQVLETGEFALDGGAMFGVVPKTLWQRQIAPDERNRINLRLRCLLVIGLGRTILIDTGIGDKNDEKFREIYRVNHEQHSLDLALADAGVSRSDITDVILTHLHFDHAGGATMRNECGDIVPSFPNATYYVQRRNFEWAQHPTEKDRASYLPENFLPLQNAGVLRLLDGEESPFTGISLIVCDGHTQGQQFPKITDGQSTLLFCADLIPTSAHLTLPWIMAYDNHPLRTLEEKRGILSQATDEQWILALEHCPLIAACIPVRTEKGFAVGKIIDLAEHIA